MEKRKLIGSWINSGSPIVSELMAGLGFDFLTVDVEHSAVDVPQVLQMIQRHPRSEFKVLTVRTGSGVEFSL